MIRLDVEQLLQFVLAVYAVVMFIVAGVFLLVVRATRRKRGLGWCWGFTFFSLALGLTALSRSTPAFATLLAYLATAASAATAYATATVAFDFGEVRRMPSWAFAVLGCAAACGEIVASQGGLTGTLLAPEIALVAAPLVLTLALWPSARHGRNAGIKTVCAVSFVLTLFLLPTIVFTGTLAMQGRPLNAVFWTWQVVSGVILASVLAMAELVALLDEIRLELEDVNAALHQALEGLEIAAKVDPLTGLLNRYAFYSLIDEFRAHDRAGGSIAILDLNNLKKINDTFGHDAGDRAILSVARRLQEVVRSSDYVFRWGGDEFVVLLFGTSLDVARDRMTHMEAPESLDVGGGRRVALTVSWGVAPLTADFEADLRAADVQLYEQKRLVNSALQPNATEILPRE